MNLFRNRCSEVIRQVFPQILIDLSDVAADWATGGDRMTSGETGLAGTTHGKLLLANSVTRVRHTRTRGKRIQCRAGTDKMMYTAFRDVDHASRCVKSSKRYIQTAMIPYTQAPDNYITPA